MEKYNLTQTGPEVQEILDNATPQSELTTETQRAQLAEQTLQTHIDNEELTRENADTLLQTNIGAEETRAKAAEKQNADDIDALEALLPSGVSQSNKLVAQQALEAIIALIPSAASALNKLADKAFVNSSIATNTATFRGTFNLVSDLHLPIDANHETIALNLLTVTPTADNNDYCFVQISDSAETPAVIASTDRYKFNGTEWDFEYTLNTSGFTTAQWDAINSGITAAILESLTGIPALIPSEATDQNQLADKAYVLAQILLATPAFKGQFTTLTQLQAVTGAKAGDLGIVRTKDTDGHDVFAFYQYKNDQWTYFYSLSYHPQDKPATTGIVGEAPYNGMGRVELPMNWVEGWPNDTWLYYPYNDVVYLMYYWNGLLYAPYNSGTQEGLGLDDNLVVKPLDYNIADIEQFVGQRYLPFTESSGVWTITKPDDSTITSTELNNTNIYKINDPTHLGINVLTQAMLNRPNTIYVIQHDYDLNGQTITVPENCMLQFEGGSLKNGSLVLQNTLFDGVVKLGGDLEISGTCANSQLTPNMFGAKGDGVTDDTSSFVTLFSLASCCKSAEIQINGNHVVDGSIYMSANASINGIAKDASIEIRNGVFFCEHKDGGAVVTPINITNDINKGTNYINVDSVDGLNIGDIITILDKQNYSFYQERAPYRKGEMKVISSIESNVITFTEPFLDNYIHDGDYTTSSEISSTEQNNTRLALCKLNTITVSVTNMKFIGDGIHGCFRIRMGKDCLIDNVNFTKTGNYGLMVDTCWNTRIEKCNVVSAPRPVIDGVPRDSYGIGLDNSYYSIVDGCKTVSGTHSIQNGGSDRITSVINRYVKIVNCFIDTYSFRASLDFHGDNEYCEVYNNVINKGMNAGGNHIYIKNNTIELPEIDNNLCAIDCIRRKGTDLIIQGNSIRCTIKNDDVGPYMFDISPSYAVTEQDIVLIDNNDIIVNDEREIATSIKNIFTFRSNLVDKIVISNNTINIKQGNNTFGWYCVNATYYNSISIINNILDGGSIAMREQGNIEIIGNKILNAYGNAGIYMSNIAPEYVDNTKAVLSINNNFLSHIGGYGIDARLSTGLHAENIEVYLNNNIIGDVGVTMTSRTAKILYQSPSSHITLSGNKHLGGNVVSGADLYVTCDVLTLSEDNSMSISSQANTTIVTSRKETAGFSMPYSGYIGIRTGYGFYGVVGNESKLLGLNQGQIKGSTASRNNLSDTFEGYRYYDTNLGKMTYYTDGDWHEYDKAKAGVIRAGTFSQKPSSNDIYIGFRYFCTSGASLDEGTTETKNIPIYHKGNDYWVDANGITVTAKN